MFLVNINDQNTCCGSKAPRSNKITDLVQLLFVGGDGFQKPRSPMSHSLSFLMLSLAQLVRRPGDVDGDREHTYNIYIHTYIYIYTNGHSQIYSRRVYEETNLIFIV